MPIEIRGNTLSFLRTELTGNNSRSVLVISREGYRLRNLMGTTGRFSACYHWCLEMAPSVNKLYWAFFLCVCVPGVSTRETIFKALNLAGEKEFKKKSVRKHLLFWFLRKAFSSSQFGNPTTCFFLLLGIVSLLSPLPKSKVKILTKWLFPLV